MSDSIGPPVALAVIVMTAVCVAAAFVTFAFTSEAHERKWQAECVNRGVAEYDSKTGAWKWSVPLIESEASE